MGRVTRKAFGTDRSAMDFLNFSVREGDLAEGVFSSLKACGDEAALSTVVRQVFFVAPGTDIGAILEGAARAYGERGPVTSIVYQPPAGGVAVEAELWAFGGAQVTQAGAWAAASTGPCTWGFVGGLETREDEGVYDGVSRTLRLADAAVRAAGFEFRQVVRTWYYIGDLLGPADGGTRYDRFNQARNEFFQDIWQDLRYSPSSTGIGMETHLVTLEAIVLKGEPGAFEVTWVDNPLQTKPFVYDINVEQKKKPSFSRAAAVRTPDSIIVFVSGTASIRRSEVICQGDATAQTAITVENIATLIGTENLSGTYGLPRGARLEDIAQFRVYIKRPEDYEVVRRECRRLLPDVPCAYLVADVCRSQCLVEIEAVAAVTL